MKFAYLRRRAELEKGQSLVEMAIGFVLLLIILSGILDLGRIYFIYVAMEDSVGEAALYLSINPGCRSASDGVTCADPNNAEFRAREAASGNIDWTTATITINRPPVYGVGDPVQVRIDYTFTLLTPFVPRFSGVNPLTLTTEASQIIIRE